MYQLVSNLLKLSTSYKPHINPFIIKIILYIFLSFDFFNRKKLFQSWVITKLLGLDGISVRGFKSRISYSFSLSDTHFYFMTWNRSFPNNLNFWEINDDPLFCTWHYTSFFLCQKCWFVPNCHSSNLIHPLISTN